ncbi:unnamed protein product [Prunus brigantina]
METSLDEEYGIPGTRSVAVDEALREQPKSKEPMDRFVTLEARQRIAAYGVRFKHPSMYELRTWILKEEVGCITVDEENRLANLFWRDSTSLLDYVASRDVLIFDSTYKTKMYDKPLVLFVSSNNHRASVSCALFLDETFGT